MTIDTAAPDLAITAPVADERVLKLPANVTGTGEPGASVEVFLDGALLGTLDALLLKPQSLDLSPDGQVLLAAHDGWLRMVHLPSGSWRVLARVGEQGWLSHDNKGRFDCGESGCEALLMRTASGQLLGVDDKLVKPLRGIGKK